MMIRQSGNQIFFPLMSLGDLISGHDFPLLSFTDFVEAKA